MQSSKRLKKVAITDNLHTKISNAKSMVITDYRGLNTSQLNELRAKLSDVSSEYQIAKNTLVKRVLVSKKREINSDMLNGPTAILYSYEDEISPIKALMQFSRVSKLPIIKGGYLGETNISASQIQALAKLPNKEILLSQVVGTMNAPISNFVGVLNANLMGLLNVLNAIKSTL